MSLASSGLAIGKPIPEYTLHVTGDGCFGTDLTVSGNATIKGNADITGNIIVNSGYLELNGPQAGDSIYMGPIPSTNSYAGLWMNKNFSTATAGNYSFLGDGNNSFFNAASNIYFRIGNSTKATLNSSEFDFATQVDMNNELSVTGNVTLNSGLYLNNAKPIYWKDNGGTYREMFNFNANNDLVFGSNNVNNTYFQTAGNVNFRTNLGQPSLYIDTSTRSIEWSDRNGSWDGESFGGSQVFQTGVAISGDLGVTGNLNISSNIVVDGTVDGRDVAADGSTLDSLVAATGGYVPYIGATANVDLGSNDLIVGGDATVSGDLIMPYARFSTGFGGTPSYPHGILELFGDNQTVNSAKLYVSEDIANTSVAATYFEPIYGNTRLHLGTSSQQLYSVNLQYVSNLESIPSSIALKTFTDATTSRESSKISAGNPVGKDLQLKSRVISNTQNPNENGTQRALNFASFEQGNSQFNSREYMFAFTPYYSGPYSGYGGSEIDMFHTIWASAGDTITNPSSDNALVTLHVSGDFDIKSGDIHAYNNSYITGNLGVGTSSPSAKIHSLSTSEQLRLGYDASNYLSFTVDSSGELDVDSTNGEIRFNSSAFIFEDSTNHGTRATLSSDDLYLGFGSSDAIVIEQGGPYVAIRGTPSASYDFEVFGTSYTQGDADFDANVNITSALDVGTNCSIGGHLSAATKSFLIDNPTKEGKKLQYGVVESDQHSVFVRGKTDQKIIELPEEWEWLVHEDSVTVQLTSVGKSQQLYIIEQNNKIVHVGGVEGEFNYTIYGERKDVAKLETEV